MTLHSFKGKDSDSGRPKTGSSPSTESKSFTGFALVGLGAFLFGDLTFGEIGPAPNLDSAAGSEVPKLRPEAEALQEVHREIDHIST